MENTLQGKRIYGLDILRAAAIFYVMLSHGFAYSGSIVGNNGSWFVFDGVNLFFVLSGFLIGGILIKTVAEKPFTFKELFNFWIRRWFRTLPNYFLVLSILVVCYVVVHDQLPPQLFSYFTFTQNFASPHPLFFGEAWSLSVEEWFYILIPLGLGGLLFITKGGNRAVLAWILIVLLAGTFIRVFKVSHRDFFADGSFGLEIGKQVITRMDGIMYGVLGAWLSVYRPGKWHRHRNLFFVIGLFLLVSCNLTRASFFMGYFYYSLIAIGTLFLLPKLSSIKTGQGAVYKTVTFISIISYSMYLTNHMIVQRAILPQLLKLMHINVEFSKTGNAVAFVLFWALTIAISYLLYRFWELPVMKLRDKIKPRNVNA